ncbi:hypothetical protein HMPREF0080_00798 [Anaeroglobus geminatus F0357]|uniref:Uncharacterized protein n=1 Tax=Anaeroglobus geminatus F0357 TaxID=861450 RepID=G9YGN0_9FIRM|nr:hypothetical protein HMPREF0080_00798 [Anaeroglobus geminatus F0357]
MTAEIRTANVTIQDIAQPRKKTAAAAAAGNKINSLRYGL